MVAGDFSDGAICRALALGREVHWILVWGSERLLSLPKTYWKRWGGRSPPPFPAGFWEGGSHLDPPQSTISGPARPVS